MTDHPKEAVEVVARALSYRIADWDTGELAWQNLFRRDATALLDQIAPFYREQVAKIVDRRTANIVRDEGSWEPDTNVTNLPEWAETACEELDAIAAAIRKGE